MTVLELELLGHLLTAFLGGVPLAIGHLRRRHRLPALRDAAFLAGFVFRGRALADEVDDDGVHRHDEGDSADDQAQAAWLVGTARRRVARG
nr:hypothetical protein BN993_02477 [Virgibacillus halodenitrificans]